MNKKEEYYGLGEQQDRQHLRFAREFSHWQPIEMRWQNYYLRHFIGIGGEKKQLPHLLSIKKHDRIEHIIVVSFIYLTEMPIEFRNHYNHWVLFALVELSSQERVIISCC